VNSPAHYRKSIAVTAVVSSVRVHSGEVTGDFLSNVMPFDVVQTNSEFSRKVRVRRLVKLGVFKLPAI
jgi:hypothetical protein